MLKDALKKYFDLYIQWHQDTFGTYPRVDAQITEEPSACFFGDMDEDGYIQWNYVEQPNPVDFQEIEDTCQIRVCEDVKEFYNSYLFMQLEGFLDGQFMMIFDPVTEDFDGLFFPPDDVPPISQYPNLIVIGMCGYTEESLCVDLVTGKVYSWDLHEDSYEFECEGRYGEPELLADSLAEILSRLSPVRTQD